MPKLRSNQPVAVPDFPTNVPIPIPDLLSSDPAMPVDKLVSELRRCLVAPGVIPWKGKPGRPPSEKTFEICERWLQLGQPKLNGPTLARACLGKQEYKDEDKAGRKKVIDKCRAAVLRVRRKLPEPD